MKSFRDDKVKLSFHYELRGEPNADYTIFAVVLHEKIIHPLDKNV